MRVSKIQIDAMFGYWKVLAPAKQKKVLCLCTACGITRREVHATSLYSGRSKNCNCRKYATITSPEFVKKKLEALRNADRSKAPERHKATMMLRYGVTSAMRLLDNRMMQKVRMKRRWQKIKAAQVDLPVKTEYVKPD